MLTIRRDILQLILSDARSRHPDMACGIVAGPAGSDRPERLIPMVNAERSPTFWRFDPAQQLRVYLEMDARDEEPIIIYYSQDYPGTQPSRSTVANAAESQAHYLIVSTRDPERDVFGSYRIHDGRAVGEEITIFDAEGRAVLAAPDPPGPPRGGAGPAPGGSRPADRPRG
jgi:proteasome lid subunit RPN8/RPN11